MVPGLCVQGVQVQPAFRLEVDVECDHLPVCDAVHLAEFVFDHFMERHQEDVPLVLHLADPDLGRPAGYPVPHGLVPLLVMGHLGNHEDGLGVLAGYQALGAEDP